MAMRQWPMYEPELELIKFQMAQKPVLRGEVDARKLRVAPSAVMC